MSISKIKFAVLKYSREDMDKLYFDMTRSYTGVPVKDHKKSIFSTYHKCFSGSEVITWIGSFLKVERTDAQEIASYFLKQKLLSPANKKKKVKDQLPDTSVNLFQFTQKKKVVIIGMCA